MGEPLPVGHRFPAESVQYACRDPLPVGLAQPGMDDLVEIGQDVFHVGVEHDQRLRGLDLLPAIRHGEDPGPLLGVANDEKAPRLEVVGRGCEADLAKDLQDVLLRHLLPAVSADRSPGLRGGADGEGGGGGHGSSSSLTERRKNGKTES